MTKEIVVNTISGWIASCETLDQLNTCVLAVHDMVWVRFSADNEAEELNFQIADKRRYLMSRIK